MLRTADRVSSAGGHPEPGSRWLPRPVAVAITGGIGAGKSEALFAFQKAGAATVSSDEIVHHLLRSDEDVKQAIVREFGEGVLDDDGVVDRKRVGEIVFGDRAKLDFLEKLLHPLVTAEYLRWREQLGELPNPPEVCVTEVPLLYETGGDKRFDKVVVITAPAKLREQRRRVTRDDRDQRLLPDKEKVKRADFAYVNTGTLDDLDAWVAGVMRELTGMKLATLGLLGIVVAAFAFYVLETEPRWYERLRYPARVRGDRRRARRELRPRAAPPRRGDLPGVEVRGRRGLGLRRRRPDAAAPRHSAGDRRPHRRHGLARARPRQPRAERPLRLLVPAPPARQVRGRGARARRLQRRPGERRPLAEGGRAGSSFRRRGTTSSASRS